jgi:hypothetical protein
MRRIKMFEAQQGRTEDYKQVDKISDERLEEITEGEVSRVSAILGSMGFGEALLRKNVHIAYCFDLDEDDPQLVFGYGWDYENLEITIYVAISKNDDDYWQVELIFLPGGYRHKKGRFRCDGLRGLEVFLREHVASKIKEIKDLEPIMNKALDPKL